MANEEINRNNPDEVKSEGNTDDKVSSRRAFAAGLATLGTAAILGGKAEAATSDKTVKNKILDRIKGDLKSGDEAVPFAYLKVGGQYAKGTEEALSSTQKVKKD